MMSIYDKALSALEEKPKVICKETERQLGALGDELQDDIDIAHQRIGEIEDLLDSVEEIK